MRREGKTSEKAKITWASLSEIPRVRKRSRCSAAAGEKARKGKGEKG